MEPLLLDYKVYSKQFIKLKKESYNVLAFSFMRKAEVGQQSSKVTLSYDCIYICTLLHANVELKGMSLPRSVLIHCTGL